MAFTKRERWIMLAAGAAVGLLVLDSYVLTPLLNRYSAMQAERQDLTASMIQAEGLLKRRQAIDRRWRRVVSETMTRNPAAAEGQILRALQDWFAQTRHRLASLRPERSAEKSILPEVQVQASGTGSISSVRDLLWKIQSAKIPIKIKMLQLGSRKEGTDDLTLQLRVSTLYAPDEAEPRKTGGGPEPAGSRR